MGREARVSTALLSLPSAFPIKGRKGHWSRLYLHAPLLYQEGPRFRSLMAAGPHHFKTHPSNTQAHTQCGHWWEALS